MPVDCTTDRPANGFVTLCRARSVPRIFTTLLLLGWDTYGRHRSAMDIGASQGAALDAIQHVGKRPRGV